MQEKIAVSINLDWPLNRYHDLFKGIQDYAAEHTDWSLVWDHFPEQRLKKSKSEPYYDGVIGRIKFEAYDEIKRLNIPCVNTWASSSIKDITSVLEDFNEVGEMAADHLIKKGFRNFVFIDYRSNGFRQNFFRGFKSVIKPYNCPVKQYLISHRMDEVPSMWNKFNEDFEEWIKDWKFPLAIVTTMSAMGPKVAYRCLENNLKIPEEVAIVSSGNELSFCEGRFPTISSVDINYNKLGYKAASLLDMKMKGREPDQKIHYIKPRGFVSRESTDSYAVKDKDIKAALRYISENYQNNIQVIDVVDSVDVSRSTLERKFLSIIGHSIFDEINRLRISSVKRLLIETELDIKKICKTSGFSNPHHLRRAFLKDTGVNPGEFRKVNQ
jgi:LacI family transcriptional regulator